MKNLFKKAVSLTIALSTVAVLSVPAFADAVATPTASKDAVAVTGYQTLGAGQYAVAVVPEGFIGANDSDIYYVNQADEATIVEIIANMLLKDELEDGNYEVRIGTNATVAEGVNTLTTIPFTVGSTSTDDFITSADTTKGKITKQNATASDWLFDGMGVRATLNLDATAYPDFTQDAKGLYTKNYTVSVVDDNGDPISGVDLYFSPESGKYVALVPSTVTSYKFKVVSGTSTNASLGLYGDANSDNSFKTGDAAIATRLLNGKLTDTKYTDTNIEKLRIDVNGDGKFTTADNAVMKRILNDKLDVMPVLNK